MLGACGAAASVSPLGMVFLVGAEGFRDGHSGRRRPRDLGSGGHQPDAELSEERGIGASRGEGEADAGGGFDDAGAELQQAQRMVANSAVASTCPSGIASRTVSISQ